MVRVAPFKFSKEEQAVLREHEVMERIRNASRPGQIHPDLLAEKVADFILEHAVVATQAGMNEQGVSVAQMAVQVCGAIPFAGEDDDEGGVFRLEAISAVQSEIRSAKIVGNSRLSHRVNRLLKVHDLWLVAGTFQRAAGAEVHEQKLYAATKARKLLDMYFFGPRTTSRTIANRRDNMVQEELIARVPEAFVEVVGSKMLEDELRRRDNSLLADRILGSLTAAQRTKAMKEIEAYVSSGVAEQAAADEAQESGTAA